MIHGALQFVHFIMISFKNLTHHQDFAYSHGDFDSNEITVNVKLILGLNFFLAFLLKKKR